MNLIFDMKKKNLKLLEQSGISKHFLKMLEIAEKVYVYNIWLLKIFGINWRDKK